MRTALAALRILILATFASAVQDRPMPLSIADGRNAPPPGAPVVVVTVRFSAAVSGPVEVVRLDRAALTRRWHLAEIARTMADDGRIDVRGPAAVETLLLVRQSGRPGYLLDGPFRWPVQPATYHVSGGWRRTIRGRTLQAGSGTPQWVNASEEAPRDAWPACEWITDRDWECVGVPLKEAGIVLSEAPARLSYFEPTGAVDESGVETAACRTAAWGRLLVIGFAGGAPAGGATPPAVVPRRMQAPRARPQSVRLGAELDTRVTVDRLSPRIFWVTATQPVEDGWVELMAGGRAPVRLDTREVAAAPSSVPLRIDLEPVARLAGTVSAGRGVVVKGADVLLYRFVTDTGRAEKRPPKRILLAETRSGDEGEFRFENLAVERYELVAMHTAYGRVERVVDPDGQEIDLTLQRPSYAIGRVLRDGVVTPGVQVSVLPDLAAYAASEDVTEFLGGETTTGDDGRFSVALAPRGAMEVRVGDAQVGMRRFQLGAAETLARVVDLGTIDLSPPPAVTLVLEGAEGCDLLLTGPSGRPGMAVVRARRIGPAMFDARVPEPGRWSIVAACGRQERSVVPAFIDVPAAGPDMSVRLSWPLNGSVERDMKRSNEGYRSCSAPSAFVRKFLAAMLASSAESAATSAPSHPEPARPELVGR